MARTLETPTTPAAGGTRVFRKRSRRAAKRDGQATRAAQGSVVERRYRQTIRRVDLWTVLKVSVCFYLTALLVTLAAGVVLWWIASVVGVIGNVEDFMGELLSSDDFEFLSWRILRGSMLIGLVLVCLLVVITVLAAAFYNLFAEILGGVEITITEEEERRD